MRCPTFEETRAGLLALLPRGRAWQSNIGGPEPYHDAAFDPRAFDAESFDTEDRSGSVLFRFWSAVSVVFDYAHQRLCALQLEMFCATANETRDQWLVEYGLPDPCDPFPDLCAKVRAIGGARCDYFRNIAAAAGWSIDCTDTSYICGARAGCARAGCAKPGNAHSVDFSVIVDLGASTSYGGLKQTPPRAGLLRTGLPFACPPDISPLACVLERVVPAHVRLHYIVQES